MHALTLLHIYGYQMHHVVLAGQVMTRMSRNFMGSSGARPSVSNTCGIVSAIYICILSPLFILPMIAPFLHCAGGILVYGEHHATEYIMCPDGSKEEIIPAVYRFVGLIYITPIIFIVYMWFAVFNTRAAMRRKYQIPPSACGECDDCCCSFFCHCCTVSWLNHATVILDNSNNPHIGSSIAQ